MGLSAGKKRVSVSLVLHEYLALKLLCERRDLSIDRAIGVLVHDYLLKQDAI